MRSQQQKLNGLGSPGVLDPSEVTVAHNAESPRQRDLDDGASGIRTRDLLNAIQALSQLSYSPGVVSFEA